MTSTATKSAREEQQDVVERQGETMKKKRCSVIEERGADTPISSVYKEIMRLFFPTLISRLAWIGMKTTDTALLGHSGTDFLTASSLSDFWTSIFGVFISDSVLGSFCGQAYGAKNYEKVGQYTQVAWTIFAWIAIPVMAINCFTGFWLETFFGIDETIGGYANYYARVLAIALPARLISGKLSIFFMSQKIVGPSSITTPLALVLNLVFGLQFVLGIPLSSYTYGFYACPVVTTTVEWFLVFLLLGYFCCVYSKNYTDKNCWSPGWNPIRDIFFAPFCGSPYYNEKIKPLMGDFFRKAWPSTLSMGSDFWRMSAIGLFAGTLGEQEVAVFNSSYRLSWMNLVVVGSFSSACVNQLSIALGTGDGHFAEKVRNLGICTVLTFLVVTVLLTVHFIDDLARIFSNDEAVIQMYIDAKWEMSIMIFFMCFAMHFESLLYALKKSETVFKAGLIGSWGGQVPAVLLLTRWKRELSSVYLGVGFGYFLLTILNAVPLLRADLHAEAKDAYEQNKKKEPLNSK